MPEELRLAIARIVWEVTDRRGLIDSWTNEADDILSLVSLYTNVRPIPSREEIARAIYEAGVKNYTISIPREGIRNATWDEIQQSPALNRYLAEADAVLALLEGKKA